MLPTTSHSMSYTAVNEEGSPSGGLSEDIRRHRMRPHSNDAGKLAAQPTFLRVRLKLRLKVRLRLRLRVRLKVSYRVRVRIRFKVKVSYRVRVSDSVSVRIKVSPMLSSHSGNLEGCCRILTSISWTPPQVGPFFRRIQA